MGTIGTLVSKAHPWATGVNRWLDYANQVENVVKTLLRSGILLRVLGHDKDPIRIAPSTAPPVTRKGFPISCACSLSGYGQGELQSFHYYQEKTLKGVTRIEIATVFAIICILLALILPVIGRNNKGAYGRETSTGVVYNGKPDVYNGQSGKWVFVPN